MSRSRLRCAIYTRKSSEEGLEQDFNSLDAQREACAAYITSQKHEGWSLVKTRYDDGGVSGGTMERPALQHLLADIGADQIDVVVVYKVDRLTRSLSDFARIVETFDAHGVSFVSVTQQFNTTTSMGRLTLNVLLSFAQFEREVTAERIRDKIAASKRKGMWMGGNVPLGYDAVDRKLVINEGEAETVRTLFRRYRELGTVRRLKEEADRRSILTKRRQLRNGKPIGGRPLTRGNLYHLLSNPIYIGEVRHKGETHPGQHDAIVHKGTWTAVQEQLSGHAVARRHDTNAETPSLLAGLVFDEAGDRLCPSHANKCGRRYRYYISRRLMHEAHRHDDGWRLPAATLEEAVLAPIMSLLRDTRRLVDLLEPADQRPATLARLKHKAETIAADLEAGEPARRRDILQASVQRVDLAAGSLTIHLCRSALMKLLGSDTTSGKHASDDTPTLTVPIELRRRGVEAKLVMADRTTTRFHRDQTLCRQVAQAYLWFDQLASGQLASVRAIAQREAINECDVSRMLRLAFLAPDIVEAILDGHQPIELTAETLRCLPTLSLEWPAQRRLLGFAR